MNASAKNKKKKRNGAMRTSRYKVEEEKYHVFIIITAHLVGNIFETQNYYVISYKFGQSLDLKYLEFSHFFFFFNILCLGIELIQYR